MSEAVKDTLHTIDKALSQCVGDFDIATAAVDALTIKVAKTNCQRSALQGLTYFSKPLDLLIQLIVSPIFIFYQTGKDIYTTFRDKGTLKGVVVILITPLNLVWKSVSHLLSTNFISTPINIALPVGTCMDILGEKRAMTRIVEMNRFGLFETIIRENRNIREVQKKLNTYLRKELNNPYSYDNTYAIIRLSMWVNKLTKIWFPNQEEEKEVNQPVVPYHLIPWIPRIAAPAA